MSFAGDKLAGRVVRSLSEQSTNRDLTGRLGTSYLGKTSIWNNSRHFRSQRSPFGSETSWGSLGYAVLGSASVHRCIGDD